MKARILSLICRWRGHRWGPVEKIYPALGGPWIVTGTIGHAAMLADEQQTCLRCGNVTYSDPRTRAWGRKLLREAMPLRNTPERWDRLDFPRR